ncbi:hypothetical protein J6590_070665 [Homalodisca vitripennis]|nr:hypothetical protein J6590_070665 [Homalodisca vitripennis]
MPFGELLPPRYNLRKMLEVVLTAGQLEAGFRYEFTGIQQNIKEYLREVRPGLEALAETPKKNYLTTAQDPTENPLERPWALERVKWPWVE